MRNPAASSDHRSAAVGHLEHGLAKLNAATGSVGLNDSLLDQSIIAQEQYICDISSRPGARGSAGGGASSFECNLEFGLNGKDECNDLNHSLPQFVYSRLPKYYKS